MKKRTVVRSKIFSSTKTFILALCLISAGVGETLSMAWVYQKIQLGLGAEVAQVTMAFYVPILVMMITAGVGLGILGDWVIRQRKFIFHDPAEGSFVMALIRFLCYEMIDLEEVEPQPIPDIRQFPIFEDDAEEIHRPKRRGRKQVFPLEAWLPIAAKWENRDPICDAFTLEDLIRDSLGKTRIAHRSFQRSPTTVPGEGAL
ncbi:MAG: hypothetical protein JW963_09600 [Anaerolineales bacterium]|nr:hypothetical protein [Anaerolineales bacterium]